MTQKNTTTIGTETRADALLPASAVVLRVGFSRQSIIRMVTAGTFPAPIKLETGSIRWLESEVSDWVARQAQRPRVAYKPERTRAA